MRDGVNGTAGPYAPVITGRGRQRLARPCDRVDPPQQFQAVMRGQRLGRELDREITLDTRRRLATLERISGASCVRGDPVFEAVPAPAAAGIGAVRGVVQSAGVVA